MRRSQLPALNAYIGYYLIYYLNNAAAKSCQSCPTLCDPIDGSPPGSRTWDSPGKHTGVGWHFLLQCRKLKSESEVAQSRQSCPTLHDPMDCNPPGSSIHGISQARVLEWGAIAFSINACKLILGLFDNLEGWEAGGRVIMEGTYVYLWLIHVDV